MAQQGQVFPLARSGRDGSRWAYRYRVGGRGSKRVQRGGFESEEAAAEALERVLEQLRREHGLVESPTLAEFVELYLAQHEGEPETSDTLRRLLQKAVRAFGERRLSELRSPAKTKASVRADPLQAIALATLDALPPSPHSALLFPSVRGGYLDLHIPHPAWKPAQRAAAIEPLRRVYDLRHTFATFALRAGISTFDLSRYMDTSLAMIDRHYGHLARDGREHAIALLDAYGAREPFDVHAVDARWTSNASFGASIGNQSGGSREK